MWRDLWATHRWGMVVAIAVTALLIAAGISLTVPHRAPPGQAASPVVGTPSTSQQPTVTAGPGGASGGITYGPAVTTPPTAATGYDHPAWDAIPAVTASTTTDYPPIPADLRTQPDTFVIAFGTELLARTYATGSRAALLSWAQSEAAPLSITQVPLTTADRDKALIVSLTSPNWDGAPSTLVPSSTDWVSLASLHAWTTVTGVKVEAVTDFPPPSVTFTDPLTLARLFTATVALHTIVGNQTVTSTSSVAFQVVLGTSLHHGRVFGAASTRQFVQRGQS